MMSLEKSHPGALAETKARGYSIKKMLRTRLTDAIGWILGIIETSFVLRASLRSRNRSQALQMGLAGQASWGRSVRISLATFFEERRGQRSPGLAQIEKWSRNNGLGPRRHEWGSAPPRSSPAEQGPTCSPRLALLIDPLAS
ncbi:uncharacterized protein BJX67DRAFT_109882 [Aspergillus lucknowensis]|uniref:Uncharacterized protein n=1 Tax=Aspergillus lucknowensis TaxID=176173 RepID=A0ABR4LR13_9EURO